MRGDDDRAAGVAEPCRAAPVPAVDVAVEEAGRERIARAEDVLHLDLEARHVDRLGAARPDPRTQLAPLLDNGLGAELEQLRNRRLYVAPDCEQVAPEWRGIGIRIEDDVLVIPEGNRVLSAAVPKHVADVEALRRS